LREIIRQAELRLQMQLVSATAAEQRALTFTALMAAVAGAAVTTGAAMILNVVNARLGWVCLVTGCALLVSMFLRVKAALQSHIHLAGNSPNRWADDVEAGSALPAMLAKLAESYDAIIAQNHALLARSTKLMRLALWTAWSSLFVGSCIALPLLARLL
jgi:hypothetical protein